MVCSVANINFLEITLILQAARNNVKTGPARAHENRLLVTLYIIELFLAALAAFLYTESLKIFHIGLQIKCILFICDKRLITAKINGIKERTIIFSEHFGPFS